MSTLFEGTLFDGETLQPQAIALAADGNRLKSLTAGVLVDVAITDVNTSHRLASLPRFLYLPGNRTVETKDNDAIDLILAGQKRGKTVAAVHWLEARAQIAAGATLLLIAIVSATLWWGLPVFARQAAMAVPAEIEARAGKTALATINQILAPSQLSSYDRKRAESQLERLINAAHVSGKPELIFRSMGGKSPNAFALPGGFIVVSDELINLPVTDDELAAVLAHEMGHWQKRHGIQSILRGSTALLLVSTITGDLSTLTTFAGSIPFLILQRGYSREFETEADAYAVALLGRAKIDLGNFETVLEKLESARPATGNDFTYLSTHPSNVERIHRINPTGRRPVVVKQEIASTRKQMPLPATSQAPDGENIKTQDNPPHARLQTPPVYPPEMSVEGLNGAVTLEFIVDPSGDTRDVVVIRSSDRRFEAAAIAAVAQWKYFPGTRDGRAIGVRASITIEFKHEETSEPNKPHTPPPPVDDSSDVPPVIPLEP